MVHVGGDWWCVCVCGGGGGGGGGPKRKRRGTGRGRGEGRGRGGCGPPASASAPLREHRDAQLGASYARVTDLAGMPFPSSPPGRHPLAGTAHGCNLLPSARAAQPSRLWHTIALNCTTLMSMSACILS